MDFPRVSLRVPFIAAVGSCGVANPAGRAPGSLSHFLSARPYPGRMLVLDPRGQLLDSLGRQVTGRSFHGVASALPTPSSGAERSREKLRSSIGQTMGARIREVTRSRLAASSPLPD